MKLRATSLRQTGRTIDIEPPGPPEAPANTVAPTITGSALFGQVLHVNRGTWTGTRPIQYTYQWLADGEIIVGAQASSFVIPANDNDLAGVELTVQVTGSNGAGSDMAESAAVAILGKPAYFQSQDPEVSIGSLMNVGDLATAIYNPGGYPAPVATYEWRRDGVSIDGATSNTYTLTTEDEGAYITVVVTLTNDAGVATAESPSRFCTPAEVSAPVNTIAPLISGTGVRGSDLTVSSGTWTGSGVITYTYQWYADDVAISGATTSAYTIPAEVTLGTVYTAGVVGSIGAEQSSEVMSSNSMSAIDTPVTTALLDAPFTTESQFDDLGVNEFALVPQGEAAVGTSKFEQGALELDGSAAQFVDGGSTSALALSGPFTIKWYADIDADSNGYAATICTATTGSIVDGFLVEQGMRGTFFLAPGAGALQHVADPRGAGPHTYRIVRDSDGTTTLYIDDEVVETELLDVGDVPCSVLHVGGDGFVAVETIKGAIGGIQILDVAEHP